MFEFLILCIVAAVIIMLFYVNRKPATPQPVAPTFDESFKAEQAAFEEQQRQARIETPYANPRRYYGGRGYFATGAGNMNRMSATPAPAPSSGGGGNMLMAGVVGYMLGSSGNAHAASQSETCPPAKPEPEPLVGGGGQSDGAGASSSWDDSSSSGSSSSDYSSSSSDSGSSSSSYDSGSSSSSDSGGSGGGSSD